MTPAEVRAQAQRLYAVYAGVAPSWDQLGDITRNEWLKRAEAGEVLYVKPKAMPAKPTSRFAKYIK